MKAIYPIIDGQKATAAHSVVTSYPATKSSSDAKPQEKPQETEDNLIDAGQNDNAAAVPAKTPDEIEKLLSSTGKPAEGPLIDFAQDVKSSLPNSPSKPNSHA